MCVRYQGVWEGLNWAWKTTDDLWCFSAAANQTSVSRRLKDDRKQPNSPTHGPSCSDSPVDRLHVENRGSSLTGWGTFKTHRAQTHISRYLQRGWAAGNVQWTGPSRPHRWSWWLLHLFSLFWNTLHLTKTINKMFILGFLICFIYFNK